MRHLPRRSVPTAMWLIIVVVAHAAALVSCGKDVDEADKFPSRDAAPRVEAGELTSIRLANGITVYMQEEHSREDVAVEVLYHAGVVHEDDGKTHVSRLLPHMLLFSPTASFGPDEAVKEVQVTGRINAEVVGMFTHFDYIVLKDQLDLVFQIESERLTSVQFTQDLIEKYAAKCTQDIDHILEEQQLSLTKYGLMAFNQAYNFRKNKVPIYDVAAQRTIDELNQFHRSQYRLEDMVVVVIGDFDTEEVTALAKQILEPLEEKPPAADRAINPVNADQTVQWDLPSSIVIMAFPGPYEDAKERLALTMFGTYLNRELMNNNDLLMNVKSTYCSNQIYTVEDIPFFVLLEIRPGRNAADTRSNALLAVDEAMRRVNEKLFSSMKRNIVDFVESSILTSQFNVRNLPHHRIIGQEALNVGIKHYLKDGRSTEEFAEFVQSITFEEAMEYITSTVSMDNIKTITFEPSGEYEPKPHKHEH